MIEEVRQYTTGLLAAHEWGVAIMYREAVSASRRVRLREEDTTEPLGTTKRPKLG